MSRDTALFRLERMRCRVSSALHDRLGLKRTVYVHERTEEYRRYWEAGARLLGAEFVPLTEDVWEIRHDGRSLRLSIHITPCDDHATRRLAGNKPYCYSLAQSVGVPVPAHVVFEVHELERARAFIQQEPGPWVLKPARDTASGLGITTGITTWHGVIVAAALASFYGRTLILERMVPGESCRLLFLGGRMVHAVRRRGVRVTGDGRRSIAELARNAGGPGLLEDANTRLTLAGQQRAGSDIPAPGEEVLVRSLPLGQNGQRELRTEYDETVTSLVGLEVAAELAKVVRALGTEFAGIDVISNDLSRPLQASGGTFLEINTTPGIHHHYIAPDDFTVNPVARQVLAHLLCRPTEDRELP
jgi:cyanophycin synthetase